MKCFTPDSFISQYRTSSVIWFLYRVHLCRGIFVQESSYRTTPMSRWFRLYLCRDRRDLDPLSPRPVLHPCLTLTSTGSCSRYPSVPVPTDIFEILREQSLFPSGSVEVNQGVGTSESSVLPDEKWGHPHLPHPLPFPRPSETSGRRTATTYNVELVRRETVTSVSSSLVWNGRDRSPSPDEWVERWVGWERGVLGLGSGSTSGDVSFLKRNVVKGTSEGNWEGERRGIGFHIQKKDQERGEGNDDGTPRST